MQNQIKKGKQPMKPSKILVEAAIVNSMLSMSKTAFDDNYYDLDKIIYLINLFKIIGMESPVSAKKALSYKHIYEYGKVSYDLGMTEWNGSKDAAPKHIAVYVAKSLSKAYAASCDIYGIHAKEASDFNGLYNIIGLSEGQQTADYIMSDLKINDDIKASKNKLRKAFLCEYKACLDVIAGTITYQDAVEKIRGYT